MDKKKLKMEALDELRKRGSARAKKVLDKYKDSDPTEEYIKAKNEGYDIATKGISQEEKEVLAEKEYRRKRKERGLR